jgi:ABC-2 type transport system ATP-binding protein
MESSSVCIDIRELRKNYSFGKVKALDGINLTVNQGDVFALIGPNGAGKTTLMGCLLALLRPSSGRISIFGKPPDDIGVRAACGFLPERPYFDAWMTAKQFLHYHHMLAGRPGSAVQSEIIEALETVELGAEVANKQVRKFSRGMLQRLGLAQVLIGKPKLCLLDEPASGMDPLGIELVRKLLLRWKEENVTVVLNSHHLDEVERVCNRYAFIRSGRIEQIEELVPNEKPVLLIKWFVENESTPSELSHSEMSSNLMPPSKLITSANALPTSDLVARIIKENDCTIHELNSHYAKVELTNRAQAHTLLKLLISADVPIEEAILEKKALADLFHKKEGDS